MIELTKQEHEALVRIIKAKLEEMGMSASVIHCAVRKRR